MVKLKNKFSKNIKNQHLFMKVKGKKMNKQDDYDRSYYYFVKQIQNHHNSEPFKVKWIGKAA